LNPDGDIITQVYNKDNAQKELTIQVGSELYRFALPGHSWATLRTMPVTKTFDLTRNNKTAAGRMQIAATQRDYRVTLPNGKSGRLELLTAAGTVLKSLPLNNQTHEIRLSRQSLPAGMILLRAVQGKTVTTARIFNTAP
jgi:hypothetical protein